MLLLSTLMSFSVLGTAAAPGDVQSVVKANNEFAFKLYARLGTEPGNVFFSPFNISHALAMLLAGARGETAAQIGSAMSLSLPLDKAPAGYSYLLSGMQSPGGRYQLTLAARLWGDNQFPFAPDYVRLLGKSYGAPLESLDLKNSPELLINRWVGEKTQGRIKQLFEPGSIDPNSGLVLTTTIYFKSAWAQQFDPKLTSPGNFQLTTSKKIRVPLMRDGMMRTSFSSKPDMVMVSLPYRGNDLSMILVMPVAPDGLPALEKSWNATEFEKRLGLMTTHLVDVALPRFKTTRKYSLNGPLAALGMSSAFGGQADFSGMTATGRKGIHVTQAVHKAYVEVNEYGTEAAAATGLAMPINAPPRGVFHADRPFLFLIRDSRTGTILFMGRVSDPR